MGEHQKTVLIAGDTPRWFAKAKSALPPDCKLVVKHDFPDIIDAVMCNPDICLCIVANKIFEANQGMRVVEELKNEGDPAVILFTREISDSNRHLAESMGAVVVGMDDTHALEHAVKTFLRG
jgi:hypothetical protein